MLTGFTVDSFLDLVDANPGDGISDDGAGNSTLRSAIQETNALGGAQSINLGAGIYRFTIPGTGENAAASGDLDVTSNLTIFGSGAGVTVIDGSRLDRVFDVLPTASLTLIGVTVSSGEVNGILADGGGIRNTGTLTLVDSSIAGSEANGKGGGISNTGNATLTNSSIVGNEADDDGGGIHSTGVLTIKNSSIVFNRTDDDGAGIADLGTSTITNTTISNNFANGDGGGIAVFGSSTHINNTIAFNSAAGRGGGVTNAGTFNFGNTILAKNIAPLGTDGFNSIATVITQGTNLVGIDSDFSFTPGVGDQVGTVPMPIDPQLSPQEIQGETTLFFDLMPGSPAIDTGNDLLIPPLTPNDQRGVPRSLDGNADMTVTVDIGAVEHFEAAQLFVDNVPSPTIISGFAGDFRVDVDLGATGILDNGDVVTFLPGSGSDVTGLIFGTDAFSVIQDAINQAGMNASSFDRIRIGPGTFAENLTITLDDLELIGTLGMPANVVIDASGGTGIRLTNGTGVSLQSLRVINASGRGIDVGDATRLGSVSLRELEVDNSGDVGISVTNVDRIELADITSTK